MVSLLLIAGAACRQMLSSPNSSFVVASPFKVPHSPSNLLSLGFVLLGNKASMMSRLWSWLQAFLLVLTVTEAQSSTASSGPTSITTTYAPQFTVPDRVNYGQNLLPNIYDPKAPVAQDLCPGYRASNLGTSSTGLKAHLTLAGPACNAYGTDVHNLDLLVEYQTDSRLHINIRPSHITAHNKSWYLLSTDYVPAPNQERGSSSTSDLTFSWLNSQRSGFGFNVTRNSTGEVLFSTTGTRLVFENQFIELVTHQSESYNIYGLGEVIHGLRMGNNFTRTIYAADVG
jgi:alpha-glucosidase